MTHNIRRRQLMKGAAWAAPSAAVAATAPAYAASSPCKPYIEFSGGSVYNQGTVYADATKKTTNQSASFGGETWVRNLPAGVTVEAMTYTFWMQNRVNNDSSGPGLFWVGNAYVTSTTTCTANGTCDTDTKRAYTCGSSSCAGIPFNPTLNSGFDKTVSNTVNFTNTKFPDGSTVQAWNLVMTWKKSNDKALDSRYSAGTGSCRTFDSGPSRRLQVNYTGVPAMSTTNLGTNGTFKSFVQINVKLSDNTELNYTSQLLSVAGSHTNG